MILQFVGIKDKAGEQTGERIDVLKTKPSIHAGCEVSLERLYSDQKITELKKGQQHLFASDPFFASKYLLLCSDAVFY